MGDVETGHLTPQQIRSLLSVHTPATLSKPGFRRSAVLVPMFKDTDEWKLLLTKRTDDLEHHKGQVSFPGGAAEENENPEVTALREAFEEVGLTRDQVELIGRLDDIWTPSKYVISPVVGVVSSIEGLRRDPKEVAKILTVPLQFFVDDAHTRMQRVTVNGFTREVYFYDYDDETIWGATAFIIRDFVRLLQLR